MRSHKIRLNEAIQRSVCNGALVGYCVLYFAFLYIYLPFCIFFGLVKLDAIKQSVYSGALGSI